MRQNKARARGFFSTALFYGETGRKGFSLTEILVVVGLLAIMSGIAVIGYGAYTEQALKSAIMKRIKLVESAVQSCFAIHAGQSDPFSQCNTLEKLGLSIPADSKIGGILQLKTSTTNNSFCYHTFKNGVSQSEKNRSRHCIQFNKNTGAMEKTLTIDDVPANQHAYCFGSNNTDAGKCMPRS